MKKNFSAACFDLDGTLIDTESIHIKAEGKCLSHFGVDVNVAHRPRTFGMGIEPGMRLLADTFSLSFASVLETYLPLWEEGLNSDLKLLPGANSILLWLCEQNVPLALVTSSDTEYVNLVDSVLGLKERFQVIITSDTTQCLKPDPMAYNEALKQLNINSKTCIGFEDSGAGIAALNAAKIFSIAVHPAHKTRPELQMAEMRVKNFDRIQPSLESWF